MTVSSNGVTTEVLRCPKCGYNLFGLPEFRCPECGTPFDPEYLLEVYNRSHLLPWERPELGGRLRRLSRTILQASIHPGQFFISLNQRKDRPIKNAGSFVVASIIIGICFHITSILFKYTVTYNHMARGRRTPLQALHEIVGNLRGNASTVWWPTALHVSTMLLSILVFALFMKRVFRNRTGALRTLDLAAVFSPAIAFGAFVVSVIRIVQVLLRFNFLLLGFIGLLCLCVISLLLVWHCCRKLLAMSHTMTVMMVITCGFLQFCCGKIAGYVLGQLQIAVFY